MRKHKASSTAAAVAKYMVMTSAIPEFSQLLPEGSLDLMDRVLEHSFKTHRFQRWMMKQRWFLAYARWVRMSPT